MMGVDRGGRYIDYKRLPAPRRRPPPAALGRRRLWALVERRSCDFAAAQDAEESGVLPLAPVAPETRTACIPPPLTARPS
eukprot:SAG31_NODE_5721_length_2360_cov_2.060593_2_plen_80_part_00